MVGSQKYRGNRLYRRFYAELAPLVRPWQWSESVPEQTNQAAKADLQEFLHRAKRMLPRAKILDFEPLSYLSDGGGYLRRLIAVKAELEQRRYDNACHELYDVVHFHCIQDRRILYTLICLLEEYLL